MNALKGKLHLTFEDRRNKTRLTNSFQQPPLRASHVLYVDETPQASVYLVETSGGIVSGDTNEYIVDVKAGSSVCLIPQSATKVYPSKDNQWSKQSIHISIEERAFLEWKPETLIPFDKARFSSHTEIKMKSNSSLLLGEILSSGREKSGESFAYKQLKMLLEIWVENDCAVFDSLQISPSEHLIQELGALEAFTYIGSLWFISPVGLRIKVS